MAEPQSTKLMNLGVRASQQPTNAYGTSGWEDRVVGRRHNHLDPVTILA